MASIFEALLYRIREEFPASDDIRVALATYLEVYYQVQDGVADGHRAADAFGQLAQATGIDPLQLADILDLADDCLTHRQEQLQASRSSLDPDDPASWSADRHTARQELLAALRQPSHRAAPTHPEPPHP